YGDGFCEGLRRLLVLGGYPIEKPPLPVWPEMLPVNRLEVLHTAQIEKGLGTTSEKTIARDIGRDYEHESQQKAEETSAAGAALTDVLARAGERWLFA